MPWILIVVLLFVSIPAGAQDLLGGKVGDLTRGHLELVQEMNRLDQTTPYENYGYGRQLPGTNGQGGGGTLEVLGSILLGNRGGATYGRDDYSDRYYRSQETDQLRHEVSYMRRQMEAERETQSHYNRDGSLRTLSSDDNKPEYRGAKVWVINQEQELTAYVFRGKQQVNELLNGLVGKGQKMLPEANREEPYTAVYAVQTNDPDKQGAYTIYCKAESAGKGNRIEFWLPQNKQCEEVKLRRN